LWGVKKVPYKNLWERVGPVWRGKLWGPKANVGGKLAEKICIGSKDPEKGIGGNTGAPKP